MPRGGARPGAGRPKGALGKFTGEGRELLAAFCRIAAKDVPALWKRVAKDKPDAALASYLVALKHISPPARAALPGEDDSMPMVIEVRERHAQSTHASEAASAAAHMAGHGYTDSDEDGE